MVTYLATVTQAPEGCYVVEFPDLPGAYAQADTLDSIVVEAQRALVSFLFAARQTGVRIAAPSSSLQTVEGQTVLLVSVDVDAYARMQDTRSVKKTVSLPAWMAEGADRAGLSLSKVLQDSLKSRLG